MKGLIIGLGSIARKHIAALRDLDPDIELFALRSGHGGNDIDGVTNIYEPFIPGNDFDFAIISNPTSLHAETIERLADTSIPLFIEKPVVDSIDKSNTIKKLESTGQLTYVACNLRFLDCLVYIHDHLKAHPEHHINEVNVYCGSYLPDWRPGVDYRKCYSAIPELGGGVNIDLIHEIDYVYWLFGQPLMSRGLCTSRSSLAIRAIDYANYVLVYPGFVASVILDYYRRDYKRTLEIVFEDSTWTVDISANTITDNDGNIVYRSHNNIAATYKAQMKYFLDMIETGCRPENDATTAFEILKICLNYERLD